MSQTITAAKSRTTTTAFAILAAISFSHLLNDMLQSLLPAIYPVLKARYGLSFGQIGAITLTNQITASILQPVIGNFTDRRPVAYSLPIGMGFTLLGLVLLSGAGTYAALLIAVALFGIGSSVFHPESSRVARLASGGRHGFAQSLFQVGGNAGSAIGPLLAAFVVAPAGQGAIAWFALAALLGIGVLLYVSNWSRSHIVARAPAVVTGTTGSSHRPVAGIFAILVVLMLSKFFYMASMTNYFTFYLISRFHLSVHSAQLCLFVFLGAVAAGTILGGPIGDRIGRRRVIWASILGVFPFTLALPYVGLAATIALTIPIGFLLASAFPAIVVYSQELVPGRVGTISGLMFGLAFGLGGIGAALLGRLADTTSIDLVFQLCAFLPILGLFAAWLPDKARLGGEPPPKPRRS